MYNPRRVLEGHHSWCQSSVPAPIASCCQSTMVELERQCLEALWDEAYTDGLNDAHDHAKGLAAGRENPYRSQHGL